jgi:Uma2 family endonuclease
MTRSQDGSIMRTILSIDEFEKLPEPEQGGGYELDEGEPVYVSPNSLEQFRIIYRLYSLLSDWAQTNNRGLVAADTWIELAPGVVRAPDVAYVPRERIANLDPKHALKVVPALAVEVLSAYNTAREMSRKIQQYRDAGIELIWVVDPEKCEVDIYSSLPLKTLGQGGTLRDDKILPGFSLPLSLVFEPVR